MTSDIAARLIAHLAGVPRGVRLGTGAELAAQYGTDEDAMILVLIELVDLGHVRRQPGGTFYSARPGSAAR